jgi:TPP-dependent pyruvate/acetoin dehydrogenase alpha subunit
MPKNNMHALLRKMLLIREFEEVADKLTLRGKVPGGMHNSAGQEAIAVGVMSALAEDDVIAATHRSHHLSLAKGLTPDSVMAELFTRSTGISKGRGGSMHLGDFTRGHYGGNGIVGAGIGIAMGAALGIHQRGDKKVSVGFVGDGGLNTGRVWEAINMAVIWKLPLIVVVENNQYAVETPVARVTGGGDIARRGAGFGLPSYTIDGQDVLEVQKFSFEARERALAGEGPTFINAVTYRYFGHNVGEIGHYRLKEEIELWRNQRDPIDCFSNLLISEHKLNPDEFDAMKSSVKEEVAAAVVFAESSPEPDPSTITLNVDSERLGAK